MPLRLPAIGLLALFAAPLLAQEAGPAPEPASPAKEAPPADATPVHPRVVIRTNHGDLVLELWPEAAPKTVENFIALAEGTKEFTDPKTGEQVTRPFYDGLTFHRIIKGFMIQGGCPNGDGSGNPGYRFEDEINGKGLGLDAVKVFDGDTLGRGVDSALGLRSREDFQRMVVMPLFHKLGIMDQQQLDARREEVQAAMKALTLLDVFENLGYKYDDSLVAKQPLKGVIAMANSGPNTNGSQFFINLADTPWLAGKHTVFGKIVQGDAVLAELEQVKVDPQTARPVEPVTILSIRLVKDDAQAGAATPAPAAPEPPATPEPEKDS